MNLAGNLSFWYALKKEFLAETKSDLQLVDKQECAVLVFFTFDMNIDCQSPRRPKETIYRL